MALVIEVIAPNNTTKANQNKTVKQCTQIMKDYDFLGYIEAKSRDVKSQRVQQCQAVKIQTMKDKFCSVQSMSQTATPTMLIINDRINDTNSYCLANIFLLSVHYYITVSF